MMLKVKVYKVKYLSIPATFSTNQEAKKQETVSSLIV